MEFNQYQHEAMTTATYHEKDMGPIVYPAFKLAGEAGEVVEKLGKIIRDSNGVYNMSDEERAEVAKEIGDVLWYCAALSNDIGYTLGRVAAMNLSKLSSRKDRGVLSGSGDNR